MTTTRETIPAPAGATTTIQPGLPTEIEMAAERSMLGAMLLGPDSAIPDVEAVLTPRHLFRPAHQTIMAAILSLSDRGEPVDPITVSDLLERRRELQKVGGPAYMHTLIHEAPTAANAGYWAEIVLESANRRAAHRLATRIQQVADVRAGTGDDEGVTVSGLIDEAMEEYYADTAGRTTGLTSIGTHVGSWLEAKQDPTPPPGLSTGLADLDAFTRLPPGELIVVAARPGIGKTVLGLKLARRTALWAGLPVLVVSLEMSREELIDRLFAAEARVNHDHIRDKRFTHDDWDRIGRQVEAITNAPLYVEDKPDISIDDIRAMAREHHRNNGGLSLIVIDYLQLIRPRTHRRDSTREREVAEMSRALKMLAKELEVPIVLLAQLNRGPETRGDKVPVTSDLRESGAIEQDANQVWLMHRPEYGVPPEKIEANNAADYHLGEVQIIVGKNRSGRTGAPWFQWSGGWQDIHDLAGRG